MIHPIEPVFDCNSVLLILGTFPSVKSREYSFYYGHPQNRFWKVLGGLFDFPALHDNSIEEKKAFLLAHRIALWDVVQSCEIIGSSDSSIRQVVANDMNVVLSQSHINRIFVNGRTAERMYRRHILPFIGIEPVSLPSTSPANAAFSLEMLIRAWRDALSFDPDILLNKVPKMVCDSRNLLMTLPDKQ